ncbi:hypothetical protein DFH09DRAFT_1253181 [Mycena vulgaris]|nr:hypothetical protein DFH09DRAFT_1253181 [Mycena vulgaris]
MILTRGLGRASFMWGSSTHNTRIERLWVEVGSQFARRWRAFFYRLEALHGLDRTNPHHLWLLHLLFLDLINEDCDDFRAEWNCHPISGEGHDQSPEVAISHIGVQDGVYVDDYEDIHPSVLERYYGVHGPVARRASGETGAGQLDDENVPMPSIAHDESEEDDSDDDLEQQIEHAHAENFHHDPSPFPNTPIRRRGGKRLRVALPDSIWRPRAEMWGRGLAILNQLSYINES